MATSDLFGAGDEASTRALRDPRVLHGTCSWTKPPWKGRFYPAGLAERRQLEWYATQFPSVEIDATYYGVPPRAWVDGWARRTPSGFVFSAKFPRSIVHGGAAEVPDAARVLAWDHVGAEALQFLETMGALGDKLGALLLQFPRFTRAQFATGAAFLDRLDAFLARVAVSRPGVRVAVVVRIPEWLGGPLVALLRAHRAALVLADYEGTPHPDELPAELDLATTDFAYARLLGDRRIVGAATSPTHPAVIAAAQRLGRWVRLLDALRERVARLYVYASDHYGGHAPATIRDLVSRMHRGDA